MFKGKWEALNNSSTEGTFNIETILNPPSWELTCRYGSGFVPRFWFCWTVPSGLSTHGPQWRVPAPPGKFSNPAVSWNVECPQRCGHPRTRGPSLVLQSSEISPHKNLKPRSVSVYETLYTISVNETLYRMVIILCKIKVSWNWFDLWPPSLTLNISLIQMWRVDLQKFSKLMDRFRAGKQWNNT